MTILCQSVSTLCLYLSTVGSGGRSSVFGGTNSSDWGRISGVDGRDGVFVYVELFDAVTPVARDTLLGVWRISSSSI